MAANPIHIVNGPYGHRYKAGDDVIINKSGHRQHDQLGKVITVRNYDDNPKITVTFEGGFDTAKFSPEELILT